MRPVRKFLVLFCILALAMVACSVTVDLGTWPSILPTQPLSAQDQVSTMVAQTLQARTQEALSATATNTPAPIATATPANTPVPPTLSVSVATNCYAGPSTNYGFVITIYPGTTASVVGKDTADNYWIIDVPSYPGTLCWLSGQYASVNGDTSNLSVPATPAISKYTLDEPRNLRVSCKSQPYSGTPGPWPWGHNGAQVTAVLRWINTDPDQTGVRVYRDGWRIATLRGHASSYTDTFFFHHWHHEDVTYGVQAFNSTEVSSIVTIDVDDCN